jgi:NADPH-dependent ferric siderophore reductase
MAQHLLRTHPLVLRRLEIARVADVTPHMRRLTLTGPQLGAFTAAGHDLPAFRTESFDDHVKLVLAADGDVEAALPVQRARSIDWPPSEHRRGRDYTPRRFDPVAGELDLDVVLHGAGPGADWARTARPGDAVHLAGPKSSLVLPADVDWVLLAGDETALPAIGRFLDERPVDGPVQVVVEVRHAAARQDLALRDGDVLRWVVTPEGAPSALVAAVDELAWWPGRPYAWVAGESRTLLPLRRRLRRDRGLPATHVDVTGYWHAEPAAAVDEATAVPAEALLSPLPWLAVRAALDLGLLDAVADARAGTPARVADVAAGLGLDPGAARVLAAYLVTTDVLAAGDGDEAGDGDGAGDAVALGPVGEQVLGDDHLRDELFGPGLEARTLAALVELAPALRGGTAPWARAAARGAADESEDDPVLYADRVRAAGSFAFVAGGVPDHPAWAAARRVAVTGPGALALLRAAAGRGALPPDAVVTAPPAALGVLAALGSDLPVAFAADPGRADLVVSTLDLALRTTAELTAHLAALAAVADRALVVDALTHSGPSGPAATAEHDLLVLGRTGEGRRDPADVARAAGTVGWRAAGTTSLGWDHELLELRR